MNNLTTGQVTVTCYNKNGFKCHYTIVATRVDELIALLIKQGYTSTKD